MSYFAQVSNGLVTAVAVVTQDQINADPGTYSGLWIAVPPLDPIPELGWAYMAAFGFFDLDPTAVRVRTGTESDDVLNGIDGKDSLSGLGGNDTLNGGTGIDTLIGGTGNDTYVVDASGANIRELSGGGYDEVRTSLAAFTLARTVEKLTYTGTSHFSGRGNDMGNTLIGASGNDTLDGMRGADTLIGGDGNDLYMVDNIGDVVTESASKGTDTVQSTITIASLFSNVENIKLLGTSALNATGNALNNHITGNFGANILDGGSGADTLVGGLGNDTYLIDANDTITEDENGGSDTVVFAGSYTLGANLENLTLAGSGAFLATGNTLDNLLTGNSGNNTLTGGSGNDTLVGMSGTDSLVGGSGNDVYIVDSSDIIVEAANAGTDTIRADISYTLGSNVENLTLTGTSNTTGTGNTLDNVLIGNAGNNTLYGGDGKDTLDGSIGSDTLSGGAGNDSYIVDNTGDSVVEAASSGTDTVTSSVSISVLFANVENLTLTGTQRLNATGNSLNNLLIGNSGANVLTGAGGADTLQGGSGSDTYIIDSSDTVIEESDAGTDSVQIDASYTLGTNLENLTLLSSGNWTATGNALRNQLVGNSGNNSLSAGAGNDTLEGGLGVDTLTGGTGNDVFLIDSSDTVIEDADGGTDTIQIEASYTLLTNFESLVLAGTGNFNAYGNSASNLLVGNTGNNVLYGYAGDDILRGNEGNDSLYGGSGNDTYVVYESDTITEAANEGTDKVLSTESWVLGANLENLTLLGESAANAEGNALDNVLVGNAADNIITGNAGNDSLMGGAGADTMIGGSGNDIYIIDNTDIIVEELNGGTDTLNTDTDYTLGANIENLILTGTVDVSGTGNTLNNSLVGNSGANILTGFEGDDTLNGAAGADTLVGGLGNDSYVVDNAEDVVTELFYEGTDTVTSSITISALFADVENLILSGTANLDGTGNELDNQITGNAGANLLTGGGGDDTLIGGAGNDTYVIDAGDQVTETSGNGTDTVKIDGDYTLAADLENLTLLGSSATTGTGNASGNVLLGNGGNNTLYGLGGDDVLDGMGGADDMIGGSGNDRYVVDDLYDSVTEGLGAGTDSVWSSVTIAALFANVETLLLTGRGNLDGTGNGLGNSITGNAGANILDGGDGDDTLNGAGGADQLIGGAGNDRFETDGADTLVEEVNGGTDTVWSTGSLVLSANIENLVLLGKSNFSGTGNAMNNLITGNTGDNVLDGGTGADTLIGGTGNDTYVTDGGDTLTEDANGGTDTIRSAISMTLASNFENLTLTGTANLTGTGNTLNNVLTGNTGNNTLDGGVGADTLVGGNGDDLYVTDGGDTITEQITGGTDTVQSSATLRLSAYVENLILTGSANLNGTGTTQDNSLTGNSGNNTLDGDAGNDLLDGGAGIDRVIGGMGQDTLTGGLGADVFVFTAAFETGNSRTTCDVITDFVKGQDVIDLSPMDASSTLSGNNAFVWLGTASIGTTTSGDLRFEKVDNAGTTDDYTLVIADTDSDVASEFMIKLTGLYDLTASDFLL